MGGLIRRGSGSVERVGFPILPVGLSAAGLVLAIHFGGEAIKYGGSTVEKTGEYSVTATCPPNTKLVIDTSQNGDIITRGATEKLSAIFNHDEILLLCKGEGTTPVRTLTDATVTGDKPADAVVSDGANSFRLSLDYKFMTTPATADWTEPTIVIDDNLGPFPLGDDGKNLEITGKGDLDMQVYNVDISPIG